jgi:hypothetical protein
VVHKFNVPLKKWVARSSHIHTGMPDHRSGTDDVEMASARVVVQDRATKVMRRRTSHQQSRMQETFHFLIPMAAPPIANKQPRQRMTHASRHDTKARGRLRSVIDLAVR